MNTPRTLIALALLGVTAAHAGSLTAPASPDSAGSAMYKIQI